MSTNPPRYVDAEEEAAWGVLQDKLTKVLLELNEGRNLNCWPLGSFGRKDADIDPEGCCGISKITQLDDEKVQFSCGGHKTFYPPEGTLDNEDGALDRVWESLNGIITGYVVEWDGDAWVCSCDEVGAVEWVRAEDDSEDYGATALRIIEHARSLVGGFMYEMKEASHTFDELEEK